MAAAAAAQALALRKLFINTLQVPVRATTAFMAEGDLTDSMDRIIEDTTAEEIIKRRRKMYCHPVDSQPVQQVVLAA
jgi:hypothetical protein